MPSDRQLSLWKFFVISGNPLILRAKFEIKQFFISEQNSTNMKKLMIISAMAFMLSSCAAYVASPLTGFIYTDLKAPLMATSNPVATKVGTAEATSILGIVATGDASIEAAARKAGITRISHVDYEANSVLGVFAKFTVYVYGE